MVADDWQTRNESALSAPFFKQDVASPFERSIFDEHSKLEP